MKFVSLYHNTYIQSLRSIISIYIYSSGRQPALLGQMLSESLTLTLSILDKLSSTSTEVRLKLLA
jgi:hypothetical protein